MTRYLALVVALAACATDDAPADYAPHLGTPESPIPSDAAYSVDTRVTFTLDAPALTRAVGNLRTFAQTPGTQLLARAQATSDAAYPELAGLPSTLRSRLDGWIDAEIDRARISTKTLRQYATDLAAVSDSVLSTFVLESRLSITPTGATHTIVDVNFQPLNLDIVIPVGGLKADTIAQETSATVVDAGALSLGAQTFGLAFGNHVWQALNLASESLYADDLTAFTVDCGAVARAVAAKCSGSSCVGHTSAIQGVCERGMAALVADLRTEVLAFQLDDLEFASGKATLVDDDQDGIADRIINGMWVTSTSSEQLRSASATFTALDPTPR